MFNYLNRPYLVSRGSYDPIIIKSGKMIPIRIKHVHVKFYRGNKIVEQIIIVKHIFLRGPILD